MSELAESEDLAKSPDWTKPPGPATKASVEIEDFIGKYWGKPGGAERATYQMFLTELAQLLGAPTPDPGAGGELGAYQFEGPVRSEAALGKKGTGRIDLYKRGCFILEAKQSQLKPGESLPVEPPEDALEPVYDLFGNITGHQAPSGKRKPRYDRLMAEARIQAERYSLALPTGHKPPPFLIVADIGRTFEFYFDWTGDGRGYGFFPDQQSYRVSLEQLRDEGMRDLLRGIWLDPASVDPRLKAVEVTGDIARRLSRVAASLEEAQRQLNPGKAEFEVSLGIEATSLFLMRVLFCMFAEDVELLPKGSFTSFLDDSRRKSDLWWRRGLEDLWQAMNRADVHNRFWVHGDALVRYFNGNLFSAARVYDLPQEFRGELYEAARHEWKNVEPAIFGTLLEQVLTASERAKLGAHYTPRPYVQRLVNATIGDVLRPEWNAVREAADIGAIRAFHTRLTALAILDPACGTGNFLYVAMELLQQLEGEAIQLAAELGETIAPAVHPNQFKGLELNPRAAVIAELVLWIGWLRHRLANHPNSIGEPVLPTLTNINMGTHGGYDAVLRRTATGEPGYRQRRWRPIGPRRISLSAIRPLSAGKYLREESWRRLCRGAVAGQSARAQKRRFRHAMVGSRRAYPATAGKPVATLRLRHHQFDHPDVFTAGDRRLSQILPELARGGGTAAKRWWRGLTPQAPASPPLPLRQPCGLPPPRASSERIGPSRSSSPSPITPGPAPPPMPPPCASP